MGLTQFRPTAIQRWFSYTGFQKFILFQTPLKVPQKCGKMKKKNLQHFICQQFYHVQMSLQTPLSFFSKYNSFSIDSIKLEEGLKPFLESIGYFLLTKMI